VIADQLEAFAADDYARARMLATQGFRQAFPVEDFRGLIEDSYPVAADSAQNRVQGCRADQSQAAAVVEITSDTDRSRRLGYELTLEGGEWRIAGAVPLEDPTRGPAVI
jgi:hypothetical protein